MGLQTVARGIRDVKIAIWSSENSWGTAYDIYAIRNATLELEMETDTLRGDDVDIDQFSKITAAVVRLESGSIDLEAVDMFIGGMLVSNDDYEDLVVGEDDTPPYIGVAGRIVSSAGVVEQHFLVPKARLSGNLTLQAQLDTYMLPQTELRGVNEGATNKIIRFRKFTAPTGLEIPLRTDTGFA